VKINGSVIVVTGGAGGIGLALSTRFVREGAQVVLSDLHPEATEAHAAAIGAYGVPADVGKEEDVANLVRAATERFGRIDMFCSNAGIAVLGTEQVPADKWKTIYDVNVLSHVYAAKYVLPAMVERGDGYLLNVASAAGLTVEFHAAPYTVSKHAAVGFAEWLAAAYGDAGIKVSVLCPAAVRTPIIAGIPSLEKSAITTDELADIVVDAIGKEQFLISTHQSVLDDFKLKGTDYDAYIRQMRRERAAWAEADKTPAADGIAEAVEAGGS
jgi:NAD(P)-dependent dehydrogenase (short-subunit alcohol dehydrogenase family)